jgi:hypothetical protein
MYFEESVSIYDFFDIKNKLKAGVKLDQINQMSLLFLKLMITSDNLNRSTRVIELYDLPWRKILRG